MASLLPHLLVVSGIPPSSLYGGGIILRRLLAEYPSEKLTVATCGDSMESLAGQSAGESAFSGKYLLFRRFRHHPRFIGRLLWGAKILQITLSLCRHIIGCSGPCVLLAVPSGWRIGPDLFVAAYLCGLLTRTPMIVYEMDDWRDSLGKNPERVHIELERIFHGRILRAAKLVWTISTSMAEQFRIRYGIETRVMPSAIEISQPDLMPTLRDVGSGNIRLLYTGAVYGAQADALVNVLKVLPLMPDLHITLIIYSTQSSEELARYGLVGAGLEVEKAVPPEQIPALLAAADGLILPFSFCSEERTVVSQSYPTKTADYLVSGVPILVHAPPYATITLQARQDGWAEIVDDINPERLSFAIRRLVYDTERRAELATNARRTARRDHDLRKRRVEFIAAIQSLAGFDHSQISVETHAEGAE